MSWLESPATNLFLLLPDFFLGAMEISSLFPQGCLLLLNTTVKSLLVEQFRFLFCLFFFLSPNNNVLQPQALSS